MANYEREEENQSKTNPNIEKNDKINTYNWSSFESNFNKFEFDRLEITPEFDKYMQSFSFNQAIYQKLKLNKNFDREVLKKKIIF